MIVSIILASVKLTDITDVFISLEITKISQGDDRGRDSSKCLSLAKGKNC